MMRGGSQDTSASGSIIHLAPDEIASAGLTLGPRYQTENRNNIEAQLNSVKLKWQRKTLNYLNIGLMHTVTSHI